MIHDPWLTEISPTDIEAAMQRKAVREALIMEQAARIAELEAALLNLIEHTLDCEIELNKLHGLGNGAGAGTSSVLCEAHAALEGRRDDPAA